ncbi:MAG: hypothetical protein C0502_00110 [Opitutus sp.]|nr:hypothetical protein [Opitutus sp.]
MWGVSRRSRRGAQTNTRGAGFRVFSAAAAPRHSPRGAGWFYLQQGMTIVPRPLVDFVAAHRARRLRARLHLQGDGRAHQQAVWRTLMARHERTEIGRELGLGPKLAYETFRQRAPLRLGADFRGAAERMAGGAADILWPGRCNHFVYTAGTVDGTPRMLPVTPDMARHFRETLAQAWLLHAVRTGRVDLFHGRHLHAGASTALRAARGARAGYLDGIARACLSDWARANLYAPPAGVAQLPEGPEKLAALIDACRHADVRLLAGTPAALLALLGALKETGGAWPRLECCVLTGAMPGIHARPLAELAGAGVSLHEIYAGAEGVFAAQDSDARSGLRLFTDAGIFFEFLPARELGGSLAALGPRCVPLAEAKTDTDYALVATTPAGLVRCLVGDTVRFTSLQPPRLVVTGRTQFLLNAFGEQTTERELTETLIDICECNRWEPVNFHVAPYHTRGAVRRSQGCHEWWVELSPGTVRTPTGPLLAAELDTELGRRNRDYTARRANGALETPVVRLVMPGVFTQWAELHPAFGGPGKLARCRNDRLMADQLAGIARFHSGSVAPFGPG